MLTEEALILLATIGATGLLVLGVAELVWPARVVPPRTRRPRPAVPRVEPQSATRTALTAAAVAPEAPPEPSAPSNLAPEPPSAESLDAVDASAPVTSATEAKPMTNGVALNASLPFDPPVRATLDGPIENPEPSAAVLPIAACRTMYNERRFAEVVSLGSAALEVHAGLAGVSERSDETAALFDLVGMSKQELDDRDGARLAFRAAIQAADPRARATYVRHLLGVIRLALESEGSDATDLGRLRELRACLASLDDALGYEPDDETILATQARAREALSPVCERVVARVVSGDEDQEARELILETLTDPAMPAAWRDRLREQLTSVSSAEIGQLTAQSIRSVQEGKDVEALQALERAERLTDSLPVDAVTEERREEFERRLWWGYTKVGLRRIETGNFEGALEPLFRALRFGGGDDERVTETRGALARALESAVDGAAERIRVLSASDLRAAHAQMDKLSALLEDAVRRGLTAGELAETLTKVAQLEQSLSETRS